MSSPQPPRAEPNLEEPRSATSEASPGYGEQTSNGVDPQAPTPAGPWWCPPRRRNRYYDGKFLSARDFALDPDYALGHRRTGHRLFHGWGVAVGLPVRWTGRGLVEIGPGLAIDPWGRELVVDRPLTLEVGPARGHHDTVIALHYERRAVARRERLLDNGRRGRNEPGQWLDTVRSGRFDEVPGWRVPEPWVPVARLVRGREGRRDLRLAGRPDLELRPTRIRRIDWPHGGPLPPDILWRRGGRLSITFDRALASPHAGLGIGPESLRLAIGRPQGLRQPLRGRVWSEKRTAHFEIDPSHRADLEQMRGANLYVTLLCDVVMDHLGRRVSSVPPWIGHHRLAHPGGLFESWCHLRRRRRDELPGDSARTALTVGDSHFELQDEDARALADEVLGAPQPTAPDLYRPEEEPPSHPPVSADGIRHLGVIDVARLARTGEAADRYAPSQHAQDRHARYGGTYGADLDATDWLLPPDQDPWGDEP